MKNVYLIPGAIVAGGILLATSLYFVRVNSHPSDQEQAKGVRPVTVADHTLGAPTADVTIVEYCDIDSSYCKDFQKTLAQLMTEYAPSGNVAWVYRHLPLSSVDVYAHTHAEAAECVAALAGNEQFFRFIDLLQSRAPGEQVFNPAEYPSVISQLGIDQNAFSSCLTKGTYAMKVQDDAENAVETGAAGAPFTVLLIKGSNPVPISGGLPYDAMKKVIDQALSQSAKATN